MGNSPAMIPQAQGIIRQHKTTVALLLLAKLQQQIQLLAKGVSSSMEHLC